MSTTAQRFVLSHEHIFERAFFCRSRENTSRWSMSPSRVELRERPARA